MADHLESILLNQYVFTNIWLITWRAYYWSVFAFSGKFKAKREWHTASLCCIFFLTPTLWCYAASSFWPHSVVCVMLHLLSDPTPWSVLCCVFFLTSLCGPCYAAPSFWPHPVVCHVPALVSKEIRSWASSRWNLSSPFLGGHKDCTILMYQYLECHKDCTIWMYNYLVSQKDCTTVMYNYLVGHKECTILMYNYLAGLKDCTTLMHNYLGCNHIASAPYPQGHRFGRIAINGFIPFSLFSFNNCNPMASDCNSMHAARDPTPPICSQDHSTWSAHCALATVIRTTTFLPSTEVVSRNHHLSTKYRSGQSEPPPFYQVQKWSVWTTSSLPSSQLVSRNHPGTALAFRDLRQPTQNIMYFVSLAQKMRTV